MAADKLRVSYFASREAAEHKEHGWGVVERHPFGWLVKGAMERCLYDAAGIMWTVDEVAARERAK